MGDHPRQLGVIRLVENPLWQLIGNDRGREPGNGGASHQLIEGRYEFLADDTLPQ